MIRNSKIYEGKVVHTRFKPKKHNFKYRVFSLLIDLDEIEELHNKLKLFSFNKFNLISFFNKDHGGRDGNDIKEWVRKNLEERKKLGERLKKNPKEKNAKVEREKPIPDGELNLYFPPEKCCVYSDEKLV
mgnify:CR=1 FL=1